MLRRTFHPFVSSGSAFSRSSSAHPSLHLLAPRTALPTTPVLAKTLSSPLPLFHPYPSRTYAPYKGGKSKHPGKMMAMKQAYSPSYAVPSTRETVDKFLPPRGITRQIGWNPLKFMYYWARHLFKNAYCLRSQIKPAFKDAGLSFDLGPFRNEMVELYGKMCSARASGDAKALKEVTTEGLYADLAKRIASGKSLVWSGNVKADVKSIRFASDQEQKLKFAQVIVCISGTQQLSLATAKNTSNEDGASSHTDPVSFAEYWYVERPLTNIKNTKWRFAQRYEAA